MKLKSTGAQYRVVWKREGLTRRAKVFSRLKTAEHFVLLFGPEPWKYYTDRGPDEYACCSGSMEQACGCGGLTVREESEKKTKDLPKVEWVRIETRIVGPWEPEPFQPKEKPDTGRVGG